MIARIEDTPALKDDLEGITLYYGENGKGYIIPSSQGNDSFPVFDRQGDHRYIGSFVIAANGALGIDGASETDGIDVISTPLGSNFPFGLVIVQDGRNLMPAEDQNYKVVPWESIADALELEKHPGWTPRRK
jgi:3-phytase